MFKRFIELSSPIPPLCLAAALLGVATFGTSSVYAQETKDNKAPARSEQKTLDRIRTSNINLSFENKAASYKQTEKQVKEYVAGLAQAVESLGKGQVANPPEPSEKVVNYLGGIYLYCVINEGNCPFLLETLLEADIIKSRLNKTEECPVTTAFWKAYLGNGFEDRHKYGVKTAYMSVTQEFNQKTRPRYVKCKSTVKSELTGPSADAEFFRNRYREGSPASKNIQKTITLVNLIADKVGDVYKATDPKPAAGGSGR